MSAHRNARVGQPLAAANGVVPPATSAVGDGRGAERRFLATVERPYDALDLPERRVSSHRGEARSFMPSTRRSGALSLAVVGSVPVA